jgi:hypothetical protein
MNVHGIIFDDECNGEAVNFGGLDWTRCEHVLGPATRNPDEWHCSELRGKIVEIRAVMGTGSCTSDADRGLLDLNRGRPFLRAAASLDERLFPSAAEFVRPGLVRWAAEGHILERTSAGISLATVSVVRLGWQHNFPDKFRLFPGLG